MEHNKLLNSYQTIRQKQHVGTSNKLLENNDIFNGNNNISTQQMQTMRQMRKDNGIDVFMDKDKIRETIIKPEKMVKSKIDRKLLQEKVKNMEETYIDSEKKNFGPLIHQYWKNRTNETYKGIITNDGNNKIYKEETDLIVHKVSSKDKEGVDKEYEVINMGREKHNDELKVIYSLDQETEHKKKFEYNHVYKYRTQYDPKDHDKLKNDKIKYYKERQKKEEEGKKNIDSVIDILIGDGIFNQNELESMGFDLSKINGENNDKNIIKKNMDSGNIDSGNIDSGNMDSGNVDSGNVDNISSKKQAYLERKRRGNP